MSEPRIVILGGGYAGLAAMRKLGPALSGRVTLVDRVENHTIKTRLYEVAVTPSRNLLIRFPLAALARASNAHFRRATATAVNLRDRVLVTDTGEFPYEYLVLAPGVETNYYGVPRASELSVSLQTYEGAAEGNRRFGSLGLRSPGVPRRNLVVCGAGLEGIEVAAVARQQAPHDRCSITIVEKSDAVMAQSQCTDAQRRYVLRYLDRHSIELRLGAAAKAVGEHEVLLDSGARLPADLVYWCAGTRRPAVAGLEDGGRPLPVGEDLRCSDYPLVFGAGDFVATAPDRGWTNLASAQRALVQGESAAENILRISRGEEPKVVRYRPKGEFVALGDFDGVGVVRGLPVYGLAAAALKRSIEARYLTELYAGLPPFLLKIALGRASSQREPDEGGRRDADRS